MSKHKNLLAPDGVEMLSLTREEWQLVDTALCGYIGLWELRAAAPKKEKLQAILAKIRGLWFEDRHEIRLTGQGRVCGHHGRDCTGRQRRRAQAQKELA